MPSDFVAVDFICLILALRRIHISSSIGCRRLDKLDRKQSNVTYVGDEICRWTTLEDSTMHDAPLCGSRPVLTSSRTPCRHWDDKTDQSYRALIHFARIRNIWKGRGCARSKALRHVYLRISSQDRGHSAWRARPTSARPTRRCSGDGSSHPPASARTPIDRWFR
jgi:hypothetical protein